MGTRELRDAVRTVEPGTANMKRPSNRAGVRATYLVLVYLFLVSIVAQVYLAGYGIFAADFDLHAMWGYTGVHAIGLLMLVAGLFARLGRTHVIVAIVNFLVVFSMPQIAVIGVSAAAAVHPVVALAVFTTALWQAQKARALVRAPLGAAPRATTTMGAARA